ncbi:MAG: hypothetical protein R3D02_00620 [Hyphomicrobiales bacterium]
MKMILPIALLGALAIAGCDQEKKEAESKAPAETAALAAPASVSKNRGGGRRFSQGNRREGR